MVKCIKSTKDLFTSGDIISFTFNTDGVPVFASSVYSIWPILIQINEVKSEYKEVRLHHIAKSMVWERKTSHVNFSESICFRM